jgi:23S rRNA pseudouridine1911/1915/1917 synthase
LEVASDDGAGQAKMSEDQTGRPQNQLSLFLSSPEDSGKRLDKFLVEKIPKESRARIQKQIEGGRVKLDGIPAKANTRLRGSETIEFLWEEKRAPLPEAEPIPLTISYEDEDLVIIDKPAGLVVHSGAGVRSGTLVNALLYHFQQLSRSGGIDRPGIVHRLDKETSGLMVVAKNDYTHLELSRLFQSREVRKEYLALVHGRMELDNGEINAPIGRDRRQRAKMTTRGQRGREAFTTYHVEKRFLVFTLVKLAIKTGRTHQIRVHLSSMHHPVVGDVLYGAPRKFLLPGTRQVTHTLSRNFLHAAHLEFVHPRTGRSISLYSPLPQELSQFLEKIKPSIL